MEKETLNMLWMLLPKVPLMVRETILHILGLSAPAKYMDLQSTLTVSVLRSFMAPSRPMSISKIQKLSLKDPGIKGRIWVSKYTAPSPPETGAQDALLSAIRKLGDASSVPEGFRMPDVLPVEAEWTGYRADANSNSTLPAISEREKYGEMMRECTSPTTVLYFHGGAYYLMDPASHRPASKKLAKITGGRCYSVRYRLAPQNPFPSALLDGLVAYLTLLYPPPEAFHEPVEARHIVLAGDSAGGNLSLALMQAILEIRRQDLKVMWFGQEREVPSPAGVATNSPWVDLTLSSRSWQTNAPFDYLPSSTATSFEEPPRCDIWPSNPPRMTMYADDAFLTHPLVTLVLARDWRGSPPVFMCTGWELLADEDKFLASRLNRERVKVIFEEYEAMPHCFAMVLTTLPGARRCFDSWGEFIKTAVEKPGDITSRAMVVKAKTLQETELDLNSLTDTTEDMVRKRIREQIASRVAASTAKL